MISVRARRFRHGRRAALALLVAATPWLLGCREAPTRTLPSDALPPVILISLDTLRADALARRGAEGVAMTPHIDRLVAESIQFTSAVTEIPFTLPAHISMLTGAAPDVHGVLGGDDRLPDGLTTLAELLASAGYSTAGIVSSDWLRPGFGFGRGFERYEEIEHGLEFAERVTRSALDSVDRILQARRAPFLFVHYYDAHSDSTDRGNRRPYWSPSRLSATLEATCREGLCSPAGECATGYLLWASHHADEVDEAARQCLFESYLAGVRALDEGVGELIAGLEERKIYGRALIVLTSDHGEEFGEHGQFVHAQTHRESIAIPLAIKLPDGAEAGRRDSRTAQLADLLPTILAVLSLEFPPAVTGTDLLVAGEGAERVAVAQNKHRAQRYAATTDRWKLIHDYVTGRSRLYDRETDPGETLNIAEQRPEIVEELRWSLEERVRRFREIRRSLPAAASADEDDVLDPDARRRLQALGYLD